MCWASKNRFVVFVSFLTCLFLISHRKCHFYLPGAQKDEHLPFVALTQFRVLNVPAFHFRVCHKTHSTLWAQKARSRAAACTCSRPGPRAPCQGGRCSPQGRFPLPGPVRQRRTQNWLCFLKHMSEHIPQNEEIVFDGCRLHANRRFSSSSWRQQVTGEWKATCYIGRACARHGTELRPGSGC